MIMAAVLALAVAVSASPTPTPLPTADAMAQLGVLDSCFVIDAGDRLGAGFLVEDGRVVTAAHVVDDATRVVLEAPDPSGFRVEGTVTYLDPVADIAIVTPDRSVSRRPLLLSDAVPPVGSTVYAVGSPIGKLVVSRGEVVGVSHGLIESSAPVDSGNSGGPLVDGAGTVMGMVVQLSETSGHAFAVPAATLAAALAAGPGDVAPASAVPTSAVPAPASGGSWALWLAILALLVALLALAVVLVHARKVRTASPERIVIRLD